MSYESRKPHVAGDKVKHSRFGSGSVIVDNGLTAVVRFNHGIEEVEWSQMQQLASAELALRNGAWGDPLEVVTRLQAEAIRSVNDVWGVFSRSKIDLLPHQLWVCRRVLSATPARWLVADDVGLGKTIEAGLVLMALASRGLLGRTLIICPASLVEQWQQRLLEMFDIRAARYLADADTQRSNFWAIHDRVIAPLQTLRADHGGRHERFFEADPWDLLIVDEAHHLNADEDGGPTLGYRLVQRLVNEERVRSMLFFTGTPHRGKDFGFLSLLKLLRPDRFDPSKPAGQQLAGLSDVMIRNNKYGVTDLRGQKLFRTPVVHSETYSYSPAENCFYRMLTEFIMSGQAYAARQTDSTQGRAIILVLIAMQKLASSSVAAIRRAIRGRLGRIRGGREQLAAVKKERERLSAYFEAEQAQDFDQLSDMDEHIAERETELRLMENEEVNLQSLLDASNEVLEETKIQTLVQKLRSSLSDRSVLFFTEYKATQSLLMSALIREFGTGCVAFINGDGRAEDVVDKPGVPPRAVTESRAHAAEQFNAGAVRFLVSTEAGGEGIDLQENCHTLVHADLPWNPMRMHQRVGRLNRLGQKKNVEVMLLHNPDTVESMIWEKLNSKIDRINTAFVNVLDDPEDLAQLVLGMAPSSLYRELFAQGASVPKESLDKWFDLKTSRLGGRDAINTVREMVGNCAKFDFQKTSEQLPQVDLPTLRPFLLNMLQRNRRRPETDGTYLSFKTPDAWRSNPAVRAMYEQLGFDRKSATRRGRAQILGVGHPVMDMALAQGLETVSTVSLLPPRELSVPLIVLRIVDRVTGEKSWVRGITVGCLSEANKPKLLFDWQLLVALNNLKESSSQIQSSADLTGNFDEHLARCKRAVLSLLDSLPAKFRYPEVEVIGGLWPGVGR